MLPGQVPATAIPSVLAGQYRYPLSKLREEYRRQWNKVLQVMPMAFGDLVEVLSWELFAPLVRLEEAESRGEKG